VIRPAFDVVLFDIDNVLIDTRASYLTAIQKTVEIYLNRPGILSLKEIDQFKLLGGFNDDWDSCYGIITFLETALQGKPVRFGDHRRQRVSIAELKDLCPQRPLGIRGLLKRLKVLYKRVETPSYKKVAKIFQEVYWKKPGLVKKERLIFSRSLLEKIHNEGVRFGIVTGRNRIEARYALKRFGILDLFDAIVTIDDVRKEEKKRGLVLRKPHPWPILEAARRLPPLPSLSPQRGERISAKGGSASGGKGEGGKSLHFLYVGDLPDDILTATRAKKMISIRSVAFSKFSRDAEATMRELKKVKPDYFLKKPEDLSRLLK